MGDARTVYCSGCACAVPMSQELAQAITVGKLSGRLVCPDCRDATFRDGRDRAVGASLVASDEHVVDCRSIETWGVFMHTGSGPLGGEWLHTVPLTMHAAIDYVDKWQGPPPFKPEARVRMSGPVCKACKEIHCRCSALERIGPPVNGDDHGSAPGVRVYHETASRPFGPRSGGWRDSWAPDTVIRVNDATRLSTATGKDLDRVAMLVGIDPAVPGSDRSALVVKKGGRIVLHDDDMQRMAVATGKSIADVAEAVRGLVGSGRRLSAHEIAEMEGAAPIVYDAETPGDVYVGALVHLGPLKPGEVVEYDNGGAATHWLVDGTIRHRGVGYQRRRVAEAFRLLWPWINRWQRGARSLWMTDERVTAHLHEVADHVLHYRGGPHGHLRSTLLDANGMRHWLAAQDRAWDRDALGLRTEAEARALRMLAYMRTADEESYPLITKRYDEP